MFMKKSLYYLMLISLLDYKTVFIQQSNIKPITIEWERTYGGPRDEIGWSVRPTTDGGFIIGGFTDSYGPGPRNMYIIKTDGYGNEQWSNVIGGPNHDSCISIRQTCDLGYIACGSTNSKGNGQRDVYLTKMDSTGRIKWEKTYGGQDDEDPLSIIETADRYFIIAGYTKSFGAGDRDIYLIKIDMQGNKIWETTLGGVDFDAAVCIHATGNQEYIICGETKNLGKGGKDIYLIKAIE